MRIASVRSSGRRRWVLAWTDRRSARGSATPVSSDGAWPTTAERSPV
jgi:hypothetical protein